LPDEGHGSYGLLPDGGAETGGWLGLSAGVCHGFCECAIYVVFLAKNLPWYSPMWRWLLSICGGLMGNILSRFSIYIMLGAADE